MRGYQQAHRVRESKDKRMEDTKLQARAHAHKDRRMRG